MPIQPNEEMAYEPDWYSADTCECHGCVAYRHMGNDMFPIPRRVLNSRPCLWSPCVPAESATESMAVWREEPMSPGMYDRIMAALYRRTAASGSAPVKDEPDQ